MIWTYLIKKVVENYQIDDILNDVYTSVVRDFLENT